MDNNLDVYNIIVLHLEPNDAAALSMANKKTAYLFSRCILTADYLLNEEHRIFEYGNRNWIPILLNCRISMASISRKYYIYGRDIVSLGFPEGTMEQYRSDNSLFQKHIQCLLSRLERTHYCIDDWAMARAHLSTPEQIKKILALYSPGDEIGYVLARVVKMNTPGATLDGYLGILAEILAGILAGMQNGLAKTSLSEYIENVLLVKKNV